MIKKGVFIGLNGDEIGGKMEMRGMILGGEKIEDLCDNFDQGCGFDKLWFLFWWISFVLVEMRVKLQWSLILFWGEKCARVMVLAFFYDVCVLCMC